MFVCLSASIWVTNNFMEIVVEDPYPSEAILFLYNQSGQCGWRIIPDWHPGLLVLFISVRGFFCSPVCYTETFIIFIPVLSDHTVASLCVSED